MQRTSIMSFKLIVALVVISLPAVAMSQPAARMSDADVATLQAHHAVNVMEIQMGKLAQQRGSEPVKKYATALIKDHQKADKAAVALARERGVTLDDKAAPAHGDMMATMERLATLEGATFDKEYLTAMVDGHTATAGKLTLALGRISDAKLKAHLTKVKPVVERHAEQARALLPPAAATR